MFFNDAFHRNKIAVIPGAIKTAVRAFRKIMVRHDSAEKHMHPVRVRKRHRPSGIAVVAALQGDQLAALRMSEGILILHCHLGGTFHRNASRIRKENLVESFGQKIHKLFAKLNCGLVRKTAEHHVAHLFALLLDRINDFRGVVPVRHAPPARHGVNQFQAVCRFNRRSVSCFRKKSCRSIFQRCIRVPQMLAIKI